jgi:hypothetical protein
MRWLWAVGPFVVVCVAVWLVRGSRRLARLHLMSVDDRPGNTADRLGGLRGNLSDLHGDLERFGPVPEGDDDAGPADR